MVALLAAKTHSLGALPCPHGAWLLGALLQAVASSSHVYSHRCSPLTDTAANCARDPETWHETSHHFCHISLGQLWALQWLHGRVAANWGTGAAGLWVMTIHINMCLRFLFSGFFQFSLPFTGLGFSFSFLLSCLSLFPLWLPRPTICLHLSVRVGDECTMHTLPCRIVQWNKYCGFSSSHFCISWLLLRFSVWIVLRMWHWSMAHKQQSSWFAFWRVQLESGVMCWSLCWCAVSHSMQTSAHLFLIPCSYYNNRDSKQ